MAKSKRSRKPRPPQQLNTPFARRVIRAYPSARALNPRPTVWIIQANEGVLANATMQTGAWELAAKKIEQTQRVAKIREMAGMPDGSHAPVKLFIRERPARSDSNIWQAYDQLNGLLATTTGGQKTEPIVVAEYTLVARTLLTETKGVAVAVKAPVLLPIEKAMPKTSKRKSKKTTSRRAR